jgi:hypothetical protein
MNFEITGVMLLKEPVTDVSASFKKREFVIEVQNERNSDWNDFVKFQLTQDRCSAIDNINVGQRVKVSFNLRGRKWEKDGKVSYFTNLEAWRVELADGGSQPEPAPAAKTVTTEIPAASAEEDLPF